MTDLQTLWRLMNYIEPFDEQTSHASVPETGCFATSGASAPSEVPLTSDEAIKDFSYMAGCLE